jgi:acetolactate synthase-1/2/3 large subunit
VEKTADLAAILTRALAEPTVTIVDCPVDYRENMKLTERLNNLVSPV